MELVFVLLAGLGTGVAVGFVVGRARSGGPDLDSLRASEQERALLLADAAESRATAAALRQQVEQLTGHKAAENTVLQQMAPIAAQLKAMRDKVDVIEKQRHEQHGEMAAQIRATRETAEKSKAAAEMLNSALRNNQQRGAYGELQLESIVEAAGLIKRVDFATQESITVDDASRRPDMVVKLPGGKEMAVDAKMPYAAYIESCRDDLTDVQRADLLKEHAKQVKAHVNTLANRSYFTGLRTSPEYTVAFIPTDAILDAALKADGTLMDYAFRQGVVLATPVNLFAALKTVAFTWKQDDIADNAREVVDMGQELFRRLRKTAENAAKLGRSIESVVKNYNAFAGSLERSVLPQARRFDDLDIPAVPELEADTRRFTAPEFAALEQLEAVERPELEFFESTNADESDEQTA